MAISAAIARDRARKSARALARELARELARDRARHRARSWPEWCAFVPFFAAFWPKISKFLTWRFQVRLPEIVPEKVSGHLPGSLPGIEPGTGHDLGQSDVLLFHFFQLFGAKLASF